MTYTHMCADFLAGYLAPCERPLAAVAHKSTLPCGKALTRYLADYLAENVCTYIGGAEIISPESDGPWKARPGSHRTGRPVTAGRRRRSASAVPETGPTSRTAPTRTARIVRDDLNEMRQEHSRRRSGTGAESPPLQRDAARKRRWNARAPAEATQPKNRPRAIPTRARLRQPAATAYGPGTPRGCRGSATESRTRTP